jgi:hypothetical protein
MQEMFVHLTKHLSIPNTNAGSMKIGMYMHYDRVYIGELQTSLMVVHILKNKMVKCRR